MVGLASAGLLLAMLMRAVKLLLPSGSDGFWCHPGKLLVTKALHS
jgi:hypothetical protein